MIAHELTYSPFKSQFDNKSEVSTEGQENLDFPSCQTFNFTHDKHKHKKTLGCKVKSSLCKNFTSTGNCPYGSRCQFAHGTHELRINQDSNNSYKTKECNSYFKKGHCQYGYRCNFLHTAKSQFSMRDETKRTINYENWKEVLDFAKNNESSRLLRLL